MGEVVTPGAPPGLPKVPGQGHAIDIHMGEVAPALLSIAPLSMVRIHAPGFELGLSAPVPGPHLRGQAGQSAPGDGTVSLLPPGPRRKGEDQEEGGTKGLHLGSRPVRSQRVRVKKWRPVSTRSPATSPGSPGTRPESSSVSPSRKLHHTRKGRPRRWLMGTKPQ